MKIWLKTALNAVRLSNLNRLTGNRGRLHSAHWLASSLKLAARCPVSGCWPSCLTQGVVEERVAVLFLAHDAVLARYMLLSVCLSLFVY